MPVAVAANGSDRPLGVDESLLSAADAAPCRPPAGTARVAQELSVTQPATPSGATGGTDVNRVRHARGAQVAVLGGGAHGDAAYPAALAALAARLRVHGVAALADRPG